MGAIMSELLLDAPNLGTHELKNIEQALATGYVSTHGPFVDEFENRLAHYVGGNVVCVQSGTAALTLALMLEGIGQGDEVIIPSLTFVGTANAVRAIGATPVIVDVEPDTWNIDPNKMQITKKTKAIIPVHLYGNPCNMDELSTFNVPIIEDAAEALGSIYHGRFCGSIGKYGALSFNGNKVITTGGGGALICPDPHHVKYLIGQAKEGDMVGYNLRMTNLEAVLGLAQLERLSDFITHKWGTYRTWRDTLPGAKWQAELIDVHSNRWMTAGMFEEVPPVTTRPVFTPLHTMSYWKQFAPNPCPESEYIYEHGICLPSSTKNNHKQITKEVREWLTTKE